MRGGGVKIPGGSPTRRPSPSVANISAIFKRGIDKRGEGSTFTGAEDPRAGDLLKFADDPGGAAEKIKVDQ